MKNFKQEFLVEPSQNQPSSIFITDQISQVITDTQQKLISNFTIGMAAATIFIAPIQTIVTTLQLSVQPLKNKLEKITEPQSKELARLNTQMTIHEKKNFEIMIRTGQSNPYAPPIYSGYIETIKGLYKHGWKSFFKGLQFRLLTVFSHFYCYRMIGGYMNEKEMERGVTVNFLKIYGVGVMMDLITNSFYIMENRHVIQSGIPEFKVFRKPLKDTYKLIRTQQAMLGWKFHIPNLMLELLTKFPFYYSLLYTPFNLIPSLYLLYFTGETLTFPFLTAYKRIVCQSERYPALIPPRYKSIYHATKVIFFEQGILGLYRGFGLHLFGTVLKLEMVRLLILGENLQDLQKSQ